MVQTGGRGDLADNRIGSGERRKKRAKPVPATRGTATTSSCSTCGEELTDISMVVDGAHLVMQSCDVCDIRRWQLAGEQIDLAQALAYVEANSGRRR